MKRRWFPELCSECGGSGLVMYEPVNYGGNSVTEECHVCKGKHQDVYWKLVERQRHEQRTDNQR